jgi:hypothetical protein
VADYGGLDEGRNSKAARVGASTASRFFPSPAVLFHGFRFVALVRNYLYIYIYI